MIPAAKPEHDVAGVACEDAAVRGLEELGESLDVRLDDHAITRTSVAMSPARKHRALRALREKRA